jgi:hypothetical protein
MFAIVQYVKKHGRGPPMILFDLARSNETLDYEFLEKVRAFSLFTQPIFYDTLPPTSFARCDVISRRTCPHSAHSISCVHVTSQLYRPRTESFSWASMKRNQFGTRDLTFFVSQTENPIWVLCPRTGTVFSTLATIFPFPRNIENREASLPLQQRRKWLLNCLTLHLTLWSGMSLNRVRVCVFVC